MGSQWVTEANQLGSKMDSQWATEATNTILVLKIKEVAVYFPWANPQDKVIKIISDREDSIKDEI